MQNRSILDEADAVIYGEREDTYGDPARNLRCIAAMWTAYWSVRTQRGAEAFTEQDVCSMMRLLKEARLANTPAHRDTLVDVCGYAALAERISDPPELRGLTSE